MTRNGEAKAQLSCQGHGARGPASHSIAFSSKLLGARDDEAGCKLGVNVGMQVHVYFHAGLSWQVVAGGEGQAAHLCCSHATPRKAFAQSHNHGGAESRSNGDCLHVLTAAQARNVGAMREDWGFFAFSHSLLAPSVYVVPGHVQCTGEFRKGLALATAEKRDVQRYQG